MLGVGRMGTEIMQAMASGSGAYRLAGVWVRDAHSFGRKELAAEAGELAGDVTPTKDLPAVMQAADVAIDFTLPAANQRIIEAAVAHATPLVCGVSGLSDDDMAAMRAASRTIPVFFSRNMSIGIALLSRFVAQAAPVLGTEFRVEIDDLHHARKVDAPSGTALLLGETLAKARGQDFSSAMHYSPDDDEDDHREPADDAIVFHVRREGSHPGRHTVRFANGSETLAFEHTVSDRRVFAAGALRAARWLSSQPAGLYGMQEMLEDTLAG